MIKKTLPILNFLLLLAIGAYLIIYHNRNQEKKAYVLNQRVFDEFKGKKELERKLTELQNSHKARIDSMALIIQGQANPDKRLVEKYGEIVRSFELEQQEISQRYTADIWKRINQYVSEYGKEKGYSFIFGATGDGNLMYAADANNITDDVIIHINKRYEAGN